MRVLILEICGRFVLECPTTEKRVFRRFPLITPTYPHAGIFFALLQSYKRSENSTGCLECLLFYITNGCTIFIIFFRTCCFHFDLQKSAQPARTNDGWHPKPDCVTYVTVKELGGNHFADRCYDCFCWTPSSPARPSVASARRTGAFCDG